MSDTGQIPEEYRELVMTARREAMLKRVLATPHKPQEAGARREPKREG